MRKRVTFRHMEATPDTESYAYNALDRVMNALEHERTPINVDLIIEPGRPHAHHKVELLVKTPNHDIVCTEEGPHLYQLLDKACDVVYRKIHEQKKRLLDARKKDDHYKGA